MFQGDSCDLPVLPSSQPQFPKPEKVKLSITGSRRAIQNIIYNLHARQFSQVQDWSPPVPTQNPGEFISILHRTLWLD